MQRPHSKENDEDLVKQNAAFNKASGARPQSKFAAKHSKKAKTGIVDFTVLQEAVARQSIKSCVLGRIVERIPPPDEMVPACSFEPMTFEPTGNPEPVVIPYKEFSPIRGKSLYQQYIERERERASQAENEYNICNLGDTPAQKAILEPVAIDELENRFTRGTLVVGSGLKESEAEEEAVSIHKENLHRLARFSTEEILQERDSILTQCDPRIIQFITKRRSASNTNKCTGASSSKDETVKDDNRVEAAPVSESEFADNSTLELSRGHTAETNSTDGNIPVDDFLHTAAPSKNSIGGSCSKIEECVNEEDLPIPPKEAKKWVHMDKVELDKLRWTTPLPPVPPLMSKDTLYVARFSLAGDLLPYDAEIDTRQGLHHHGDEPGRPGYSLDELFVLVRSSVQQQRQLALSTLAAILSRLSQGHYFDCFQTPLLCILLESGLVLLLRFSLDDTVPLVRAAGIAALASLLAFEEHYAAVRASQPWSGPHLPGIASVLHSEEEVQAELKAEEQELMDEELLRVDVVRALIRVDTLVRLRYVVEELSPPPETVLHILSILSRVAAHSLTSAWKVASTPRLLAVLLDRFLPCDTTSLITGENVKQMFSVEGIPLRQTLILLQILCSWGRELANELLTKLKIMPRLLAYASMTPSEVALPFPEVLKLSIETYSLWSTFLAYGLQPPQSSLLSFYPLLVRQLYFYRDKVSVTEDTGSNRYNFELGTELILLLRRALSIASTKGMLSEQLRQSSNVSVSVAERVYALQQPLLDWAEIDGCSQLVVTCARKWFAQLQRAQTTFSGLRLLGSVCLSIENYFRKLRDQPECKPLSFLEEVAQFHNETLTSFLKSSSSAQFMSDLLLHSPLCSNLESSHTEDPQNLSSLNTITLNGSITPILREKSPFPLFTPMCSLLLTLHQLHPDLPIDAVLEFVEHPLMLKYLNAVIRSNLSLRFQWFTRAEAEFLASLCQIAVLTRSREVVLYHNVAIVAMSCLQRGQEHLCKQLFTSVICNSLALSDLNDLTCQVDNICLGDYVPLNSPALKQPIMSSVQLGNTLFDSLPFVSANLVTSLFNPTELKLSAICLKEVPFMVSSLTVKQCPSHNIFDHYWPLQVLKKQMHEKIIKTSLENDRKTDSNSYSKTQLSSDQSSPELISVVSACIQLSYLLLKYRKQAALQATSVTGWIRHLSLVFLAASDLFLDNTVNSYLQACLYELFKDGGNTLFDDKLSFVGLGNTYDWYKKLIEHYESVSYCDSTFAMMLLLLCQQSCPTAFRSLLWGDKCSTLPLIRLKPNDLERFIPLQSFLEPAEQDEEVLAKYCSALSDGLVSEGRTPLLWVIARHHLTQRHQM